MFTSYFHALSALLELIWELYHIYLLQSVHREKYIEYLERLNDLRTDIVNNSLTAYLQANIMLC